jgi:hypothetical protein
MKAILYGNVSGFDNESWLAVPPPKTENEPCPQSDVAQQHIMQTFVRLPRLIRLVRMAREQPQDALFRDEAQTLAIDLFETDLEHWIQDITEAGALEVVPTARPDLEPYGITSFSFASPRIFLMLTQYWAARILVCGCVQALCDLAPLDTVPLLFDQAAARAEDVRAATNIAMCAQYAFKTSPIIPVVPLRLQMPIIVSFGAWHRLETRALIFCLSGNDTPASEAERLHAHTMKLWCVRLANDIGLKWNGALTNLANLEEESESFAGGYLPIERTQKRGSPPMR